MIWLTWRQSRLESLIGGVTLALVAAFLLKTGLDLASHYRDAGLPGCVANQATDEGCRAAARNFLNRFNDLRGIRMVLLLCVPFLVGLLLAAPIVLDFEHGTFRLAWVQSVTRRRWLATKILYGVSIAVATSVAFVLLWTWSREPIDTLQGRFNSNSFDFEGTVPIAYTVFAFALCLAAGTLLRRAIPAVGIGLVGFLVARGFVSDQLRDRFLDPKILTWDPTEPAPAVAAENGAVGSGNWIINEGYLDATGNFLHMGDPIIRACMSETSSKGGALFDQCLHDHGYMVSIIYHPADRFWTFQAIETALFLGLAAAFLGLTVWWVTRRIA